MVYNDERTGNRPTNPVVLVVQFTYKENKANFSTYPVFTNPDPTTGNYVIDLDGVAASVVSTINSRDQPDGLGHGAGHRPSHSADPDPD